MGALNQVLQFLKAHSWASLGITELGKAEGAQPLHKVGNSQEWWCFFFFSL